MTQETRRRKWRWLRHVAWVLGAKIVVIVTGVAIFFGSGVGNPLLTRLLVSRLEKATGGRVELRSLSIRWFAMQATIKGLVIHGKEPAGTEPLFTAEEVQAGLRIDSFWGRRISLGELVVQKPHAHVLVEKNGNTNLPTPQRATSANKPLRDSLFGLRIRAWYWLTGGSSTTTRRLPSPCMGEICGSIWTPAARWIVLCTSAT